MQLTYEPFFNFWFNRELLSLRFNYARPYMSYQRNQKQVAPMAKTAAERKAAQRERQAKSGSRKFELLVDAQELQMLEQNCALRRPGREPYDMVEYLTLLIRKDNAELVEQLKDMSKQCCGKCGDSLPVKECVCDGDSQCWLTRGWHETKLAV